MPNCTTTCSIWGRRGEQRITPELAQQLGQRLGVKAYLAGTIASLGPSYVISINAVNCATGEVFAREQETATDKTAVLAAVAKAATAMRARLGESMASIQKLSTPYTNVTTTSLQAFHAFSLGEDEHRMGRDFPQASSFYQEALRLDPSFAMAYARLGVAYGNQGAITKAIEYLKKAYDLRERVTERERMYIESQYALQQYDLPKALQAYKLFVATYPRDAAAWNNLANAYGLVGDLEQALAGFQKTWEIAKWNNVAANNAAGTLIGMDRLQEGERYMKEAVDLGGSDDTNYHSNAMTDDFLSNRSDWEKHLQWAAGRPDGFNVEANAASIYFSQGRMHDADRLWEHAGQRAEQQHLSDAAGGLYAVKALHDALVSNCPAARDSANRGLAIDHSVATVPDASLALALCGDTGPALKEMGRLAADAPNNTLANEIYLPEVKAAVALSAASSGTGCGVVVSGCSLPAGVEGPAPERASVVRDEECAAGHYRLRARHPVSRSVAGRRSEWFGTASRLCSLPAGNGPRPNPDRSGRGRANLRTAAAALEECRRRFHPRAGSPARAGSAGRSKELEKQPDFGSAGVPPAVPRASCPRSADSRTNPGCSRSLSVSGRALSPTDQAPNRQCAPPNPLKPLRRCSL